MFYFHFQIEYFRDDIERYERKVNTREVVKNDEQIKEDLELFNKLHEISIRKKLEKAAGSS